MNEIEKFLDENEEYYITRTAFTDPDKKFMIFDIYDEEEIEILVENGEFYEMYKTACYWKTIKDAIISFQINNIK